MNLTQWFANKTEEFGGQQSWKQQCVTALDNAFNSNNSTVRDEVQGGLVVEGGGNWTTSNPLDIWGINHPTCNKFCGRTELGTVFDFQTFAAGATNYLLPWLALTAQLPFETGENEVGANVMSFCYALGSPFLITYSLMITVLNQHWLRSIFHDLEIPDPDRTYPSTAKRVRMFLQESQQQPLRLSQEDGCLASLILLPENANWWDRLKKNIYIQRRGVTLSLIAQLLLAILSWVLTVTSAFSSALGNPTEALVLSSGSLWIWLVPVICGWIMVGTQTNDGTVIDALSQDKAKVLLFDDGAERRVSNFPSISRDTISGNAPDRPSIRISDEHSDREDALRLATPFSDANTLNLNSPIQGSTQRVHRPSVSSTIGNGLRLMPTKQKAFHAAKRGHLMRPLLSPTSRSRTDLSTPFSLEQAADSIPLCLGMSVEGDEKQEGPTFNYARIFTWYNVARNLHQAFETTASLNERRINLQGEPVPLTDEDEPLRFNVKDGECTPMHLARYCGLARQMTDGQNKVSELSEYPKWSQLDAGFFRRVVFAMFMGGFVQWGTTGAAIIISYLTEVQGWGCRSGGYALYGFLGTASFAFLFASSLISHAAMLRHEGMQRQRVTAASAASLPFQKGGIGANDHRGESFELNPFLNPETLSSPVLEDGTAAQKFAIPADLRVLRAAAVLTRLFGRFLAVANTLWLFLSSIWELVGFYENCWCNSVALSRGKYAWVVLFITDSTMAADAKTAWAGGVFLSIFVGVATISVVWLYCRGNTS